MWFLFLLLHKGSVSKGSVVYSTVKCCSEIIRLMSEDVRRWFMWVQPLGTNRRKCLLDTFSKSRRNDNSYFTRIINMILILFSWRCRSPEADEGLMPCSTGLSQFFHSALLMCRSTHLLPSGNHHETPYSLEKILIIKYLYIKSLCTWLTGKSPYGLWARRLFPSSCSASLKWV